MRASVGAALLLPPLLAHLAAWWWLVGRARGDRERAAKCEACDAVIDRAYDQPGFDGESEPYVRP